MYENFITILIAFLLIYRHRPCAEHEKMVQKTEFKNRLAKEAQTVESIESDFTQVKYLDVFDEKVTSKGKFYYQKAIKSVWNTSARWIISS